MVSLGVAWRHKHFFAEAALVLPPFIILMLFIFSLFKYFLWDLLRIKCYLNGLHTLKIKETNRLVALKNELDKFGLKVIISEDSISFGGHKDFLKPNIMIETYDDHRMAMAFACLAVKTNIIIRDPNVVSKSYKTFWSDLNKIGILTK